MNARLKVLHQKSNVKQVKLQPTTLIGRSTECDLKIASNLVSRRHCRIILQEDAVYIEDLGSANGTFLDGQPLKPHQPTAVSPGGIVVIGPAEFQVDYVAPTSKTVVIRRSDSGAKPGPQDIQNAAKADDSQLFITSVHASFEDVAEVSTVNQQRTSPTVPKTAEAVRTENRAQKPEKRPIEVTATSDVETPSKSRSVPPVAVKVPTQLQNPAPTIDTVPVVAKAVAVASAAAVVPKADVARAAPRRAEPVQPPSDRPFQFGVTHLPDEGESKASTAKPVAKAPTAPAVVQFEEAVEATSGDSDGVLGFNFVDDTEPRGSAKSSAKTEPAAGLKSLFSMFGGKPKSAGSRHENSSEPAETVDEISKSAEDVAADATIEAPNLNFSAAEVEASEKPTDEPPVDDDFQNFLKQF